MVCSQLHNARVQHMQFPFFAALGSYHAPAGACTSGREP